MTTISGLYPSYTSPTSYFLPSRYAGESYVRPILRNLHYYTDPVARQLEYYGYPLSVALPSVASAVAAQRVYRAAKKDYEDWQTAQLRQAVAQYVGQPPHMVAPPSSPAITPRGSPPATPGRPMGYRRSRVSGRVLPGGRETPMVEDISDRFNQMVAEEIRRREPELRARASQENIRRWTRDMAQINLPAEPGSIEKLALPVRNQLNKYIETLATLVRGGISREDIRKSGVSLISNLAGSYTRSTRRVPTHIINAAERILDILTLPGQLKTTIESGYWVPRQIIALVRLAKEDNLSSTVV